MSCIRHRTFNGVRQEYQHNFKVTGFSYKLFCLCMFFLSVLHVLFFLCLFFSLWCFLIELMLVDQMGRRFSLKGTSCNSVSTVSLQGCCWRTSLVLEVASRRSVLLPHQWHWIQLLSSQEKVCKTAAFVSFSQEVDNCAFYVFTP